VDPAKLAVEWEDVEKCWLTADELAAVASAMLPANLALVRDAFVFCCYTSLRYSDLHDLHPGNVHNWQGSKVLRFTQTKTRTGVSNYVDTMRGLTSDGTAVDCDLPNTTLFHPSRTKFQGKADIDAVAAAHGATVEKTVTFELIIPLSWWGKASRLV